MRSIPILMIFSVVMCNCLWAQSFSGLRELVEINKDIKSKRISSYDRSGGNQDYLPINAGETREIFAAEGAGIITHIWVTINHNDKPYSRRNVILRMYWDGEESPSVESPIGDFFGQGWGEFYEYISLPLCAAPKEGKSMVSYFPMPYGNGARITIENDTEEDIPNFYYYVDYEEHKSIPENTGRFHAWWNHEVTEAADEGENEWELITTPDTGKNVTGDKNYLFMEAEGAGHFVGVNYYVNSPTPMWYGEGDDMFFIDGESWPSSLHGTGTEDYFNTGWCPKTKYLHPYFGLARVNNTAATWSGGEGLAGWQGRTHCYRFHIQDPVRFSKSLKSTIEHGRNNVLTLEIASVAYWYQTEPHKSFPALESRDARTPKANISFRDMHRWRDAWREKMGSGKKLWGNEENTINK